MWVDYVNADHCGSFLWHMAHVNVLMLLMSMSTLSKSLGVEEASSARASSGPLLRTGRGSTRIQFPKLELECGKYQQISIGTVST